MKTEIKIVGAVIAALIGMAVSCNPPAHAVPLSNAEQQFVSALEAAGIVSIDGDDSEMVQGGWETCQLLASGLSRGAVMGQVLRETMNRLSIDQAGAVVDAATEYLCSPTQGA